MRTAQRANRCLRRDARAINFIEPFGSNEIDSGVVFTRAKNGLVGAGLVETMPPSKGIDVVNPRVNPQAQFVPFHFLARRLFVEESTFVIERIISNEMAAGMSSVRVVYEIIGAREVEGKRIRPVSLTETSTTAN